MRPPCELVVRFVLPAFRSLVAKELIEKHHISQVVASELLGTTQAAVSYYLYSKRGDKVMKKLESMPTIRSAAKEVAKKMVDKKFSLADSMSKFCTLCMALRKSDIICDLHHDYAKLPESCKVCPDMAQR
jgi:predicted transcriptional regulator